MAVSRLAGLDRNRDREHRDTGAAGRRGRAGKPGVEALEQLCLLSLAAPPPIDEFAVPTPSALVGVAAGPDGTLWFTETSADRIGRITAAGAVTEFTVPSASSSPSGITAGPDGALWLLRQRTVDTCTDGR